MSRSDKPVFPKSGLMGRRDFVGRVIPGAAAGALLCSSRSEAAGVQDVPYFSSRSDLTAPLACARMVLSNYDHAEHFQAADVSEMVFAREGRWLFEAQLLPIFGQRRLGATLHSTTPYGDLARGRGLDRYGPEAGSRIDREALSWAAGFFNEDSFRGESVDFEQVLAWRRVGAVMMVGVSRSVLRGDPGLPYCRYNIVLTGEDAGGIYYHDPALGPHRRADRDLVQRAYESGPDRAVIGTLPRSG